MLSGQSSTLSWSLTGASTISITPAVSTGSLNPISGTATVTPASTTTYTLIASNSYSQTISTTTIITVLSSSPQILETPSASENPASSYSTPAYCLVNNASTYYLILNGIRHPIASPGLLFSWGYKFNDSIKDNATYQNLATGDLLLPNDGALIKSPNNPTVYLVASGLRHGFTSASVFKALGYKFSSVLVVPETQLKTLSEGSIISNSISRHLKGTNILYKGTIYLMDENVRNPYSSLGVYNSWNLKTDFSRVVPVNASDLTLPLGTTVTSRTSCSGQ
jgi:hypothetical protein